MEQLVPAAKVLPQEFVCAKSPEVEMPEIAIATLPLFDRVTV